MLTGDLTQAANRLTQVNRPKIPRKAIGRHLLTAGQGLSRSGRQIGLTLIQGPEQRLLAQASTTLQHRTDEILLPLSSDGAEAHIGNRRSLHINVKPKVCFIADP